MTTESHRDTRPGGAVLFGAAVAALLAGLVLTVVAGLVSGSTAALSAAVGTGLVVVVIGFGVFVLNTVASVMPSATVLVALVTYALQLVVLAAVALSFIRNGVFDETLDRRWFGGGVALATAAWMVAQIVAATKARIPVYDLPEAGER